MIGPGHTDATTEMVDGKKRVLAGNGKKKKRILTGVFTAAKWLLFLAVLYFVGRALKRQFAAATWEEMSFNWLLLALALLFTVGAKALHFLAYRLLLASFGRPPGWLPLMVIAWIPEIGKYMPGKVASLLGAVWLLRRYKVPGQTAVTTVYIMNGLWVVVGLLIAVPVTLWGPLRAGIPMVWLWCPALALLGLVCMHPKVFGTLGNFLLRKLGHDTVQRLPRMRDYVAPAAVMFCQWCLIGLGFWCAGRSISAAPAAHIPLYIAALAMAGTLGFLAIFAPGRLGVQEGLLLLILAPMGDPAYVATLVVAIRIVHIVADLLLLAAGLGVARLPASRRYASDPEDVGVRGTV